MEVEIHGMPQSIKTQFQQRARTAKTDLQRLKKLSRDLATAGARDALLGGRNPAGDNPYGDDRTRLLAGTETLADGTRRLEESQRIALETEDIGADILRNLHGQREQIEHARETVRLSGPMLLHPLTPCSSAQQTARSTRRLVR